MSDPLFTVLMPTHYRPDVIGFAIQSVLDQTFGDFELLVVGDGAVPGTAEAVAAFKDPRIRWFDYPKAPNFGYANRNRALLESRGELIGFAADDDLLFPDHLELFARAFADPSAQIVFSRRLTVDRSGRARPGTLNPEIPDELALYRAEGYFAATSVAYRASAVETRASWPDLPKSGDRAMYISVIERHGPQSVRYVREVTTMHFVGQRKYEGEAGATAQERDKIGWWPPTLWPEIAEGVLEQSVYAAAMRADPQGWTRKARIGVEDILSRQVQSRHRPSAAPKPAPQPPPPAPPKPAPKMVSQAELKAARERAEKAERQLDGMRKSLSWRLTRPLRALRRLFMR